MQKLVKKGKISGTESHITTLEYYQSDFKLPFMKNIDTEHSSISRDILLCSVSIGHGHLYIWTELLSKLGVFLALVDLKC